jgi:CHAT domain-containing protein/lipopolysaccharide biosynthesis regulator YciM
LERAEHFFELSKHDSALCHYDLAARGFKIQKVWKKYLTAMAGKAHTLIKLRVYDDARNLLDSALFVGDRFLGKSTELATVYFVYGILLDLTNKPEMSLAMHQKALSIRKSLLGTDHIQVSESYNGIGEVYRYILVDYVEAEKYFQRALDILERNQNVNQKRLYRSYYNLATTIRHKNDFERALGFAFKAVQTLGSINPMDTTAFIGCYSIIANIYNDQGAFDKAVVYYRKALTFRWTRKEMSSEMANDYTNLSLVYIGTNNFQKALHCVDSALAIIMRGIFYDSAGLANIYMIKGKALREAGRYQEAIQNYHRSLAIQKKYSRANVLDISDLYRHLSETMHKSKQYDSALDYIQMSIQYAIGDDQKLSRYSNPSYERLAHKPQLYIELAHKGAVLVKLAEKGNAINTLQMALACFDLSDRLMDIYWNFQESENSKLLFSSDNYYIYELALSSLHKLYGLTSDQQYKARAFELMDKSKSRILRQGVEQARLRARKYIPDSLLSQELNIKSSISSLTNQLSYIKDVSVESALNLDLLAKQKELEIWKHDIKSQFPQYAFESKNLRAMNLSQLQAELGNEVIFVEYLFGEEAIYIFASFKGEQHCIRIANSDLKKDIYKFCGLLSKGLQSKDRKADFKEYITLAFSLYSTLLDPVVKAFNINLDKDLRQLLVIPDGALGLLPFQALLASQPIDKHHVDYKRLDYLVNHFTISYSFDAASPFASNHASTHDKNLLAFGWSDGTPQDYTAEDLPGTYKELQAISNIIPGEFRMGKEAIKKTFKAEASAYNILHLAVHGVGDERDIYNNYLQFRDEKLFAHELYGYNLNANLTVLSACETGYGKVFTAEGVYSIARGFFYAGSKSLLMTLWRINDGENVPLIQEFYKNLEAKEYSSKALRKSQLDYLEQADEYSSHPRFWAGLVLWGNYKDITNENARIPWRVGAVLFLMGGAGLSYFLLKKRKLAHQMSETPTA